MNRHALLLFGLLLVSSCKAGDKKETFTFVDLKTGDLISNATVEIYQFASDVSYDSPHPDLLTATYRTDIKGMAQIDLKVIPIHRVVIHIAGYVTTHITYSPVLDKLAMAGDVRGHIRVVRIEDYNRPILGNSIYNLDAREEYFVAVTGDIRTNHLETIRIEMKKSEPDTGAKHGRR
jgi:hypothetical protein